jgi:hypothetical protein
MKTNRSARRSWKLRITVLCFAIATLAGIEFTAGESLAARFGQVTAPRTQVPQAPSVGLSDLMGAMR